MAVREQVYGYFIPSVTLIGIGAAKQIPKKIKALGGSKPLIVTDKGITGAGITKQITDLLDAAKMKYVVYDETIPNPTDKNVHDGVDVYKKEKCDSLITLGGGSSHDCGKGVGLVIANGGKIHDYEGVDKSSKPMPPYLAVNTTAGTASEMTRFCLITAPPGHLKRALVDWGVTAAIAVAARLPRAGMPPALTAATGMDALTHAVEAYVSTIANPMTDSAAEKAIELIAKYLRPAVANGQDIEAREGMCFAQYLAGMAFNNASLGHVHAMAHQLGGFYDLPHGECNAILLPHVEKFNLIAKMDRFVKIAQLLGENTAGLAPRDAAELALVGIKKLSADIGIPSGLIELGKRYGKEVKASDIDTMVGNAQKDACGLTNPRCPKDIDVKAIYTAAL